MTKPNTDTIVMIEDAESGSSAKVLVGFGFNCYAFQVPHGGRSVDVIWAGPDFESGNERPSSGGIPILFPFPGRIGGDSVTWNDRTYPLETGDGRKNAIHGFVFNRPWRLIDQSANHVTAQFQASVDDASILERWPADFRVTATYRIDGHSLVSEIKVENPDNKPLPCGLGTHPYFCTPLGGRDEKRCIAKLPVRRKWELIDMLPSGKSTEVDLVLGYLQGVEIGGLTLDDVFTDLDDQDGFCEASIEDPDSKLRMTLKFDSTFVACIVYNPGHREAMCIEPYTCIPDAIRLTAEGTDAGLTVLEPGQSFVAQSIIRVEPI